MTANFVVTCTKRKTHAASSPLRLRDVSADTSEGRAEVWTEHIRGYTGTRIAAADLYAGDHWSIARSLPAVARTHDREIRLWVCSAGYGLIPVNALLAPYSATFSPSHPDSVRSGVRGRAVLVVLARWWSALSRWEGPQPAAPRSLTELVRMYPTDPLLVVASTPYLHAMHGDLVQALAELKGNELLSVISGGTSRLPGLEQHLLPFDARLQRELGGGLMSLNIRVAREFFRRGWSLGRSELAERLGDWCTEVDPFERPERKRLTDAQVRHFICASLHRDPSLRWSRLLRDLRRTRRACEQGRFKQLYEAVRESLEPEPGPDLKYIGAEYAH